MEGTDWRVVLRWGVLVAGGDLARSFDCALRAALRMTVINQRLPRLDLETRLTAVETPHTSPGSILTPHADKKVLVAKMTTSTLPSLKFCLLTPLCPFISSLGCLSAFLVIDKGYCCKNTEDAKDLHNANGLRKDDES